MRVCYVCQCENSERTYFCENCGAVVKGGYIKFDKLKEQYENRMRKFIKIVKDKNGSEVKILWDSTINEYVQTLTKIKNILLQEEFENYSVSKLLDRIVKFISKCSTPEFHIAFVGAIKAGKSTLINALLGKQLASTSVTPETAVLTKFRSAKDKNFIKLSFYNEHEWNELWKSVQQSKSTLFFEEYNKLNGESEKRNWIGKESITLQFEDIELLSREIEKWTSSKQTTHYFVKEVEVGLVDFDLPEQVVFVDTPGLDDAVEYRSNITRQYIDRANAVFVCVKSDAMTGPELATLYRVFSNTRYNPEKVYVIGTQWDALSRPEENWQLQKREWIKYLKQDDCYGSEQLATKNIFSVAAHVYNLVLHYDSLDEDSKFELESIALRFKIRNFETNLEKLRKLSNVDYLKHILSAEIVSKYKELFSQDLRQSYIELRSDIEDFFLDIRENSMKLLEVAESDVEKIQLERQKMKEDLEEIREQRDHLLKTLDLVRRSTEGRVQELCNQIQKLATR
ncbi:MAG: dynamin family protein [Anoxybacillus gonensis]|nr:dynamin family protein [Anoxybacillus gonensis]